MIPTDERIAAELLAARADVSRTARRERETLARYVGSHETLARDAYYEAQRETAAAQHRLVAARVRAHAAGHAIGDPALYCA